MALLHHPSDAGHAGRLATWLTEVGITVGAVGGDVDGVVVFLSAAGLAEPWWLGQTGISVRLVPVRVGEIDAGLVPEQLRELNWIDWQPTNLHATFGFVVAGLLSDPARRDLSRQLSHEAEAWHRAGRPDGMLIADYRRARRMLEMLRDLEQDRLAVPSGTMTSFVQRSVKVSRPRHRRRRNWRIGAVVVTVLALGAAAVTVPAIRLSGYNNHGAIVTTGNQHILADLPEWSAANAAALMINGTAAERALARGTLLQAMNLPWEISALQYWHQPYASAPFRHGTRAIISINDAGTSAISVLDVRTTQRLWSMRLPGVNYYLSVTPDGATALALNDEGAFVIDLTSHSRRRVAAGTRFADGRLGSHGVAVVRLADMHVAELNIFSGSVTDFGRYPKIISVAPKTSRGPAVALVGRAKGRISLIDLASRRVMASMPGNSSGEYGTISPDGRHAAVEGGDGQFWLLGAGTRPTPTGIVVPRFLSGLSWVSGNRLVVYSEDRRGEVYYLPRAELLGVICRENTRLFEVVPDYGADVVACEGQGSTSLWRVPPGPLRIRPAGESSARSATAGDVTVASRGSQIQIKGPGSAATGWFQPLDGGISAVAVSGNGRFVVVGDRLGGVAVVDGSLEVTAWRSPDRSPIVAVGWRNGPVATTRSGQSWQVPACGNCGNDLELVNTYRARASGCFTARQLQYMSDHTRLVLGLRRCDTSR